MLCELIIGIKIPLEERIFLAIEKLQKWEYIL